MEGSMLPQLMLNRVERGCWECRPPRLKKPVCVCMFPGNDKGCDFSFMAASKLKTSTPLVWQETFETIAKTSVSFSLATKCILRDRLQAYNWEHP